MTAPGNADRDALLDLLGAVERAIASLPANHHHELRLTVGRVRRHIDRTRRQPRQLETIPYTPTGVPACPDCGHAKHEHERPFGCSRCGCELGYWGDEDEQ